MQEYATRKAEDHTLKDSKFDDVAKTISREMRANFGDYATREALYRISRGHLYYEEIHKQAVWPLYLVIASDLYSYVRGAGDRGLHNITKIGYSARLRYLLEADRRKSAMSSASILYSAAIVLILIITVNQTIAVLIAGGWR